MLICSLLNGNCFGRNGHPKLVGYYFCMYTSSGATLTLHSFIAYHTTSYAKGTSARAIYAKGWAKLSYIDCNSAIHPAILFARFPLLFDLLPLPLPLLL